MAEAPFSLTGSRHDLATFWGRVRHFRDVTDPRTLLVSDARLYQSLELLAAYKAGQAGHATNGELWFVDPIDC